MKLYFKPGACSLSPHIVLREAGLPFDLVRMKDGKLADGTDFKTINPRGYVPTLVLDDGQTLTEGTAIVQYLADRKPETKLAPAAGTMERVRLQEWLNFVATELHKNFSPLFNPKANEEFRASVKERIADRIGYVASILGQRKFLTGETFTVADAYLFTILRWTKSQQIDLGRWPAVKDYVERISARPAVKAALEAESAPG
jgi:glutathione S-transferase